MSDLNFSTFLSPFTWRYGSGEMRTLFSEEYKFKLWRKIWTALAQAEYKAGLVSKKELDDLKKQQDNIDIARILEIEKEVRHDVVAAIHEFAEKAKVGGGKIHLGATSMDIVDNADSIRNKQALLLIEEKVIAVLKLFTSHVKTYAKTPCLGFTHLQPAEPTTAGYRLAFYAQDLLTDFEYLQFVKKHLFAKGIKGATGTAASYSALLKGKKVKVSQLEKLIMKSLGLDSHLISSQVYSRKTDFLLLSLLASIASTFYKFASDLRILQSAPIGEWSEPFGKRQVGSSAMPFKKNPINCEKICSLARLAVKLPAVALENASHSYLERTLDDSANRRIITPQAFLAVDEILKTAQKILSQIVINKKRIAYNLSQYGAFAATEAVLMETVKRGADRQKMHGFLREISLQAWQKIQEGRKNPLEKLLLQNKTIQKFLSPKQIKKLFNVENHIGDAPERAIMLVEKIEKKLKI